jgi:predicted GNAT family N-acyltransferase
MTVNKHELSFRMVAAREITDSILASIFQIKDQHWPHGLDEQKKWWKANSDDSDELACLFLRGSLIAFLKLRDREVVINNRRLPSRCMTEVCVEKSMMGQNIGRTLLKNVFAVLEEQLDGHGHLLCTNDQLSFYKKCGMKVADKAYRRASHTQDYIEIPDSISCCIFAQDLGPQISIKLTGLVY